MLHKSLLWLIPNLHQFGVKLNVLKRDLTPPSVVLSLMIISQMRKVERRRLPVVDLPLSSLDRAQMLLILGVIIKYLPEIPRVRLQRLQTLCFIHFFLL